MLHLPDCHARLRLVVVDEHSQITLRNVNARRNMAPNMFLFERSRFIIAVVLLCALRQSTQGTVQV